MLKSDQRSGCQSLSLPERVEGAPNFREEPTFPVYGVANPTVDGIRAVIQLIRGMKGGKLVLWRNMREEPVIYINGKPFVLREVERPVENMLEYTGIDRERVERIEANVRSYLNSEAAAVHTPTESIKTTCELNFWQATAAVIKDSYVMERWTEALPWKMFIANLDDEEAYWIILMLFDCAFKNKASVRILFSERFLHWKVFPVPWLRWILQITIFCCSPISEEHSQEQTNKIQFDVISHLVRMLQQQLLFHFKRQKIMKANVSGHLPVSNGNDAKSTLHVLQNNGGDHLDNGFEEDIAFFMQHV